MKKCIVMHEGDTVATALDALSVGDAVRILDADMREVGELVAREAIPFGHKVALSDHAEDAVVVKYGHVIGKAVESIESGRHAHVHNVASLYTLG